jgi:hypothetical protein
VKSNHKNNLFFYEDHKKNYSLESGMVLVNLVVEEGVSIEIESG